MLTKEQIKEIREHLEKAQNPIFYYDNDADGLCSFILLRRFIGRGYGVAVRSYPELDGSYASKAQQLKADYVFVLDKPVIAKEFFSEIDKMQLPLVWIDHHANPEVRKSFSGFENVYLYNPCMNKEKEKSSEPTSYLCYKISDRKEDIWLALMGCIADHYLPDFAPEFGKKYPELWGEAVHPFDVYYKTEIGRMALALNFGLKDSVSNIVKLQNFLVSSKGPEEVASEIESGKAFSKKYREIKKKYDLLLSEAKKEAGEKLLFFRYSGDLSISADLANELSYLFRGKYIAVAYTKGAITNISMRGKNVKAILEKVLKNLENATGGGHEDAVGSRIRTEDLEKFKELFEKEI